MTFNNVKIFITFMLNQTKFQYIFRSTLNYLSDRENPIVTDLRKY